MRLAYESLDTDCPDGHRTVALVHVVGGAVFEANHVRPDALSDPEWVYIQSDHPETGVEVRFVRPEDIRHIELKYIRGEKPTVGFVVD